MTIELQKAVIKGIGKSRFDPTRVAIVSVRFLLFYDGSIIPGHQIVKVRVPEASSESEGCRPQEIISAAQAQLTEYFEGGPSNGENIFREWGAGVNQDGLTDTEERSLFRELISVARELEQAKISS